GQPALPGAAGGAGRAGSRHRAGLLRRARALVVRGLRRTWRLPRGGARRVGRDVGRAAGACAAVAAGRLSDDAPVVGRRLHAGTHVVQTACSAVTTSSDCDGRGVGPTMLTAAVPW